MRVAAQALQLVGCPNLLQGDVRDSAIVGAISNQHHGDALAAAAPRPVERHAFAREFLQGGAIGGDSLLEPRRAVLPLAERPERITKAVLRRGLEALVKAMCAPEVLQPPRSSLPARERLRELLLTFAAGVAGRDSVRLYRAIVAEADRMPGLGAFFGRRGRAGSAP